MVKKKSIFPLTKLSDVVSMKSGESITAERITSEGKFPCFGGNGLRGYTTTFTHDGSYTLVGRQGALCGNVTFVSGRFYASEHAIVVTPKKETDIKFMSYVLYDMNLNQYSESSAQPGLSVKKLLELEYPIPQNKEEQTAIAEALSDIDGLISSLKKLIEKKKAIKQGAMQELLTGKKRLPGFSGEWSNLRIEEIANLHDNLRVPVEKSMREKGNIPYYGANGIQDYVNGYTHNGSYVLIAEDGANDLQEYPIRYASGKMWVNNHVHVLDGKNSVSDTRFLSYSMSTIDYQAAITGGTRAKLNGHILMQLALDLPPLAEQQAIAQVLSDMDSEIEQLKKKLSKYQQIKQGMMQELLTGRIRLVDADGKEQPKTQVLQEKQAQPAHNQHFDDAVMIAGIVNAFYSEKYPLGRKKVQKLLYLVRRKEQADISAFHKKAAGPYADEVRYKGGEPIAQKNKYIQVKRSEKGSCFEKGVQMQQALTYLKDWGKQADVDWLVSQFQYTSVNALELLARVDMAICDLRREGKGISVASIKDLIRSNKEWRDKLKKAYFKDADIQRAIKHCQELFPDKEG